MTDALRWLFQHWPATLGILGGLGGVIAATVRRYRKSVAREFEPFSGYVYGTLKFAIGRYFSGVLARQFGIRRYVAAKLAAFPTHLLVPSVDQAQIEIDTAYVRLSLSSAANERTTDASLLATDVAAILIFGEPGSGKSSLTKKLFRQACKTAYRFPDQSQLPIHIELRELQWARAEEEDRDPGPWLGGAILQRAANVPGVHNPKFTVNAFIRTSGLVVFLDGLDEVPSASINFACRAILELTESLRQHSPMTTVITTARTQLRGVLPRPFVNSMGSIYQIDPFSPADIFSFLRRWRYKGNALTETQRIFSNLQKHQTMSEMCTNPLVLSMYVAQDQRYVRSDNLQSARFPDTRPEFYNSVVGELLLYRRSEQLGQTTGGSHLRKQREMLLGRIALDHLLKSEDPANSISWDLALAVTLECVGLPSDVEAEQYLVQLSIDTGIFAQERPGESLRFMHLTLCEYLAAKEAIEAEAKELDGLLVAVSGGDGSTKVRRLWEAAVFAVALLPRGERQRALEKLDALGAPVELIMRSIREAQAYDLALFDQYLRRLTEHLGSTPIDRWDAEWLSNLRLTISCLTELASLEHLSTRAPALRPRALLRDLTGDDADRLEKLFDLYLEHSPAEALVLANDLGLKGRFRSATRLVDAMEQPDFVVFGMNQVSKPSAEADSIFWAQVLAEAGLKYALVAQMLLDERPLNHPFETPQHNWATSSAAANSLYGSTLSIATSTVGSLTEGTTIGLPRVGILSMMTPDHIPIGRLSSKLIGLMLAWYCFAFLVLDAATVVRILLQPASAIAYYILLGISLCGTTVFLAIYKWRSMSAVFNILPSYRRRQGEKWQQAILNISSRGTSLTYSRPVLTSIGGRTTLLLLQDSHGELESTYVLPPPPIFPHDRQGSLADMRSLDDATQADLLMADAGAFKSATDLNIHTGVKGWRNELLQLAQALLSDLMMRRSRSAGRAPIVIDLNTGRIVSR